MPWAEGGAKPLSHQGCPAAGFLLRVSIVLLMRRKMILGLRKPIQPDIKGGKFEEVPAKTHLALFIM